MPNPTQAITDKNVSESKEDGYPPDDRSIARMLNYLLTNKKLPADLPQGLIEMSREGRTKDSFPKYLIPKEAKCVECEYTLCEQLITSKGKITGLSRVLCSNHLVGYIIYMYTRSVVVLFHASHVKRQNSLRTVVLKVKYINMC